MMITLFLRKHITQLIGNTIEMQYIGQFSAGSRIAIFGTQNDLQSLLTLQCQETRIDRVISQSGDRLIFERLATPRPAPKVTLEGNWLTQQQQQQPQQPTLKEGVNSIPKEIATWESNARVRDGWKNGTEVELAAGNSKRTDSKVGRWYSCQ